MKVSTLKIQRMTKEITQWELAQKLGVSESTISRVETGKISIPEKIFQKLCRILDCNPKDLKADKNTVEVENGK